MITLKEKVAVKQMNDLKHETVNRGEFYGNRLWFRLHISQ